MLIRSFVCGASQHPFRSSALRGRADSSSRTKSSTLLLVYCRTMASTGGPGAATSGSGAPAAGDGGGRQAALVWFRNDLRLADHEPLFRAALSLQPSIQQHPASGVTAGQQEEGSPPLLLPFYCLDERQLLPRRQPPQGLGIPQLGPHRLRLLLEGAASLRRTLRQHGSDLVWHQGRPEALVGRLVALAAASGSTRVALHHYLQPGGSGGGAGDVEQAVADAFVAAAAEYGLASSVHCYWGCTLYHPDDLPHNLYRQGAAVDQQQQQSQQQQQQQQQPEMPSSTRTSVDVSPQRFACLPAVMTDFRKVLQAHTPVRLPLPALLPAGQHSSHSDTGSGCSSSSSSSSNAAPILPPLPPSAAAAAAGAGLLPPIPTDVPEVYTAAGPAAAAALQSWEELTGQRAAELAPAGSGKHDPRSAVPFSMGEEEAVRRLRYYLGLQESDGHSVRGVGQPGPLQGYQESRMQAVGVDNSAKLSQFMSLGCLSPRTVYAEVMRLAAIEQQQQERGQQQQQPPPQQQGAETGPQDGQAQVPAGQGQAAGTSSIQAGAALSAGFEWREPQRGDTWHWLLMHLAIRDFFVYSALKQGPQPADQGEDLAGKPTSGGWQRDEALFRRWVRGQTGLPFVDACMRELAATGYTSNRGRQNVASLLAKALRLDWRLGADYTECQLVDGDWAVNGGNWSYCAGTGADPRDRVFKTVTQGLRYDPEARLVCSWLPELAGLQHTPELAHQPWAAPAEALAAAGVNLGTPEGAVEGEGHGTGQQGQVGAVCDVMPEGTAATAAAGGPGSMRWYPLPVVNPATQTGKGPKQKQKQ